MISKDGESGPSRYFYEENGLDHTKALLSALGDRGKELGLDTLGGFLSGLFLSGGKSATCGMRLRANYSPPWFASVDKSVENRWKCGRKPPVSARFQPIFQDQEASISGICLFCPALVPLRRGRRTARQAARIPGALVTLHPFRLLVERLSIRFVPPASPLCTTSVKARRPRIAWHSSGLVLRVRRPLRGFRP